MPTWIQTILMLGVVLVLAFPLYLEWRKRNKSGPQ